MKFKTFRRGGVHPRENKLTAGLPITEIPASKEYAVLLSQHIGAPARPIVKPKDTVKAGQKIAEAGGFVSAPLHSPVDGTVTKIDRVRDMVGYWQDAIIIAANQPDPEQPDQKQPDPEQPEAEQHVAESPKADTSSLSSEEIIAIVADNGIVGLGGATFPTRVKLTIPEGKNAEFIIINGAECEPYLTCDDALMRSRSRQIITGTSLLMRATGAPRAIIGIENNKPDAIKAMTDAAQDSGLDITVQPLRTKYPQGGEKQLIYALTGRTVPAGGLPIDVGCVVDNVATAYALYEAAELGRPLTRRIVTVTGPSLLNPGNFMVEIGTPISEIIAAAGGLPEDTGKIIAGGPMMGRSISNIDAPATKGLSGLTILPITESRRQPEEPCIRCSRCVDACPMGLEPYLLGTLGKLQLAPESRDHGVMNCLECGCCTFVCPSHRPLVDYLKLAKQLVRNLPKE